MGSAPSVASAVRSYLSWLAVARAPSTVAWYRHFLERFATFTGDILLSNVNRLQIETFSGKHHALAAVRAFCRWCRKVAKFLKKNPCKGVRVPPKHKRKRVLSRGEQIALRRSSGAPLRYLVLAIEEAGFRPAESRVVSWEMIRTTADGKSLTADLAAGRCYFEFDSFKACERRCDQTLSKRVPITPRLGRLLVRLRGRADSVRGPIFRSVRERPWTKNSLRCSWRRLRARVNVSGKVIGAGVVPYALRHTKGTNLHRNGVSAFHIRDWLGHVDLETTAIYVHSTIDDLCGVARRRMK